MRQSPSPSPESQGPSHERDWRGVAQLGLLLLFLFALAGGIALLVRQGSPGGVEITLPEAASKAQVTVHISGAVASPGVYTLQDGDRLRDLVNAAGGLAPDASPERVNLAVRLQDAERYHLPRLGEEPAASAASPSAGRLNLNAASLEQLIALPGIGPVRAQAVLDYRQRNGRFQRLEDLLQVPGIGPALMERLRELVTVE